MGELQAEAMSIEYGWNAVSIIRPSNVYGSWDNFDPNTAMVIPSLIARIVAGENPLTVWGDGSAIRDFVHARDVARAMLFAVQNEIRVPMNIGSGIGISIKEITEIFKRIIPELKIEWNPDKPKGDDSRVMDMSRLDSAGFKNMISLDNGINETLNWYRGNTDKSGLRYNAFNEGR
jgi:GDP-L-fucose synthase